MCATERIFPAEAWDENSSLAAVREALEAVRWPEGPSGADTIKRSPDAT
jgi:hypothetical protein